MWAPAGALSAGPVTHRVSVAAGGVQGNDMSYGPSVSFNGRYVAFASAASNLVKGDTNRAIDVFVRDRATGAVQRVSVSSTGAQANGTSELPTISADGRFVVFESVAGNLVAGGSAAGTHVYIRDTVAETTRRVDLPPAGVAASPSRNPRISSDGRTVVYTGSAANVVGGHATGHENILVWHRLTRVTQQASLTAAGGQPNGDSTRAFISPGGRFVVFDSGATNLVAADTNGATDVFVRDLQKGTTVRVSVTAAGGQANGDSSSQGITANANQVVFTSAAANLVAGDRNGSYDVFVRDRGRQMTTRISVTPGGGSANGNSYFASVSADGRYVAFSSSATNLVAGDTNAVDDIFVRDRVTGTTRMVSVTPSGAPANHPSGMVAISPDGRFVAFDSAATNLVAGDTNAAMDVFIRGPLQ